MDDKQGVTDFILQILKDLLERDRLEEACEILDKHISSISREFTKSITNLKARLNRNNNALRKNQIDKLNADIERNKILTDIQDLLDEIPNEINLQKRLGKLPQTLNFSIDKSDQLEKILGSKDNLLKISWLDKAINAAKSVCRVVRSDGQKGTGFVLVGGFLLTNYHVLPNSDIAGKSKIEFNFEEDIYGNTKEIATYSLDPNSYKFSPLEQFDYAYIKIIDKKEKPLSSWGFLEIDFFSDPQIGELVNIIQHPEGNSKHIVLTSNDIINVWEHRLFYKADTKNGSSGSPVFNNEWKVIAIHHAGNREEDGGIQINSEGKRIAANEGILMKVILTDINNTKLLKQNEESNKNTPKENSQESDQSELVEQFYGLKKFCIILLSIWISALLAGLLLGKSKKPDYNHPEILNDLLISSSNILFHGKFYEFSKFEEFIHELSMDELYRDSDLSTVHEFDCVFVNNAENIQLNYTIFFLKYLTIECEDGEYYFNLRTANIDFRKKIVHNNSAYKIKKQGIKNFDLLNFFEAIGAFDRGKYVAKKLPVFLKTIKNKSIIISAITLGTFAMFYVGFDIGFERGNPCLNVNKLVLQNADEWLRVLNLKRSKINGNICYYELK